MPAFKRIHLPVISETALVSEGFSLAAQSEPAENQAETDIILDAAGIDKSTVTNIGHIKRSGKKKQEISNVLDVIYAALEPHNIRPRVFGNTWVRIPAIWRDSRDFNVSVHLSYGFAIDFPDNKKRIEFSDLMKLLDHTPGDVNLAKASNVEVQNSSLQRIKEANTLWNKGTALTSVSMAARVVRKYLKSRGIPDDIVQRIAPHTRAVPGEYGGYTFIVPIYRPTRDAKLIGVQRTFLTSNGEKYGTDPKKMLGSHFDGDRAGGYLIAGDRDRFDKKEIALCEGFETGLAVHAATGMPVYVLYDAAGIRRVNLEYLSGLGVESVLIAADNDDPDKFNRRAGQESADFIATEIAKLNIPVRIALPSRKMMDGQACDWLDIWNKDPAATGRMIMSAPQFEASPEPPPAVRQTLKSVFKKKI